MNQSALIALVYGIVLAFTAWREGRRTGHPLPGVGGGVLGGAAAGGGLLLAAGHEAGRGLALLAAVAGSLFFGWMVSRAVLAGGGSIRRWLGALLASLATTAVLVLRARGTP
jgi:hypothetical protein